MTPPVARVETVTDTYFGTTIDDPYRWLEDWQSDEARAFVEQQGAYARAYLDSLPAREPLLARISELSDAGPVLYNFQVEGGRSFYLRRDPGDNVPKLVVRVTPDASEKILLDPNALSGDVHTVIDWYFPSRDGTLVAYGSSQGGSEDSILYVLDVDNDEQLADAIPGTRFGNVGWLPDGRSFVYHRLADLDSNAPPTERYFDSRTYIHHLGDDPEGDRPVFGRGLDASIDVAREDFPFIGISEVSDWMLGLVVHGVLNELTIYSAPLADLTNGDNPRWRKVADVDDAITGVALRGDTIYLRTHKDAPRYKVIATCLETPNLATAEVVIPETEAVIEDVLVAGDYLLTRDLDGGIGRVRRLRVAHEHPLPAGEIEAVSLPFDGTISEWTSEGKTGSALLQLTSWTESPRVFRVDGATGAVEDTGWVPPSPIDMSDVEAHEVEAPTKDGTLVPLSIIHKNGLVLDGGNPTLLVSYGSYGLNYGPRFLPSMLAWYERGGVYAFAHVRGGGEYGNEWHEAGRKLNKQNTIDDFIACAEYLIDQGYTRPDRLAGEGTSAGGIPSGNALVQRPDLWAVMVMRVAVTNMLRFEQSDNGPPNVPEFGSVSNPDGFRALQIMDSYHKVQNGTPYPAVLLTTGLNDPRVIVWEATKMAARLQAATTSSKPILLRVETHGGHGIGSSKAQLDAELADKLAFLLDQFCL